MNDLAVSTAAARPSATPAPRRPQERPVEKDPGDALIRQFGDSVRFYAKLTPQELGPVADAMLHCEYDDFNDWRRALVRQPEDVRERVLRRISRDIPASVPSLRALRAIGIAEATYDASDETRAIVGDNLMDALHTLRDERVAGGDLPLRRYQRRNHDQLFKCIAVLAEHLRGEHATLADKLAAYRSTLRSERQRARLRTYLRSREASADRDAAP